MKKNKPDKVNIWYQDGRTEIISVPQSKKIGPAVAEHVEANGGNLNDIANWQIVG